MYLYCIARNFHRAIFWWLHLTFALARHFTGLDCVVITKIIIIIHHEEYPQITHVHILLSEKHGHCGKHLLHSMYSEGDDVYSPDLSTSDLNIRTCRKFCRYNFYSPSQIEKTRKNKTHVKISGYTVFT